MQSDYPRGQVPRYSRRSSKRRIYDRCPIQRGALVIPNFRTLSRLFADRGEEANRTGDSRGGETAERPNGEREERGDQGGIAEGTGGGGQEAAIREDLEGTDRGERGTADPRVREEAGGEPADQFEQHRLAAGRDREAAQQRGGERQSAAGARGRERTVEALQGHGTGGKQNYRSTVENCFGENRFACCSSTFYSCCE